jgi:acylphosphatase
MTENAIKAMHAIATGHVQGVGFRYFVEDFAQAHALAGWVRNRRENEVEVFAQGSESDLNELINALWRGPGSALVFEVKFDWLTPQEGMARFSILPTEY